MKFLYSGLDLMNVKIATKIKEVISKIIPDSSLLRCLAYLPKLEKWTKKNRYSYSLFKDRYDMYEYLNSKILKNCPINFLEFGVFKGTSIQCWSNINTNSKSRFVGFDTFTGLPDVGEKYTKKMKKGAFNNKGEIPEINDNRISFVKGLFQMTLPSFIMKFPNEAQLVIHVDSDLYSSALYILTQCNDILTSGAIIIFDEFSSILHEFRALEDYCSSYMRKYTVLGVTRSDSNYYSQVAIQML